MRSGLSLAFSQRSEGALVLDPLSLAYSTQRTQHTRCAFTRSRARAQIGPAKKKKCDETGVKIVGEDFILDLVRAAAAAP